MARKTYIAPPVSGRGLFLAGLGAGFTLGVVFWRLYVLMLSRIAIGNSPIMVVVVLGVITLLLTFVWPVLLARLTIRFTRAIVGILGYLAGMQLAELLQAQFEDPAALWLPGKEHLSGLIESVITTVVMLVLGVGAFALTRWLLVRTLEQPLPSKWCWRCRYEITGLPSDRCPECAADLRESCPKLRRLFAVIDWLSRRRWALVTVVCGLIIPLEFWLIATRGLPVAQFYGVFSEATRLEEEYIVSTPMSYLAFEEAAAVAVPIPDRDPWRVRVVYRPRSHAGRHRMELSLCTVDCSPPYCSADNGRFGIAATLDETQARHVLARGIPKGLIDEITRVAVESDWGSTGAPPSNPPPQIDPDPYFTD